MWNRKNREDNIEQVENEVVPLWITKPFPNLGQLKRHKVGTHVRIKDFKIKKKLK